MNLIGYRAGRDQEKPSVSIANGSFLKRSSRMLSMLYRRYKK
jgi:hypothetical protein